jgi:PQQ-dependent dehydrogenase (methanol/ethanol family)
MKRRVHQKSFSLLTLLAFLLVSCVGLSFAHPEVEQLSQKASLWPAPGRDYHLTRYSPLSQINSKNVKNLDLVWSFSTGVLRGHEGQPLVIGNTMYLVTPYPNIVYALDISKGNDYKVLWKYVPQQDDRAVAVACCDTVTRGIFYADGKIVMNTLDGHVIALDAKTGKELWKVKHADPYKGETITMAPIVAKDKVIVGISGGEFGVRGRVAAYDLNSGKRVWLCYNTGPDQDMCYGSRTPANYKGLGVNTWQGDQWKIGGATVWGWFSYDPKLNLVYYGTSNPGTWNPYIRCSESSFEECQTGRYDNKWSISIIARDVDTGEFVWAFQMTPYDQWDYDGVNEMVLLDVNMGGKKVPALIHFSRNGFAYLLDRTNGKLIYAKPYVYVNWAKSWDERHARDGHTFNVVKDPAKSPWKPGDNKTDVCPSAMGGKDQQPIAYSPDTGLVYVPTNQWCMDYEPAETKYTEGAPYVGANVLMKFYDHKSPIYGLSKTPGHYGRILAWDPAKGEVKCYIDEKYPTWSGILVTKGGVGFYGTMDGWFRAFDLKTCKVLWSKKLGSGIIGNPISYEVNGKQYVAVFSGIGGWAGLPVTANLDPNDPYGALGSTNLSLELDLYRQATMSGVLYVFSLE